MEQEEKIEVPKKKALWIKLAIALLIIFTIGQLSAIYLSAMIGQSPKPASLIGSILWPGLLLLSIWSIQNKRKVIGFILGSLVGFALHFGRCRVG